MKPLALCLVALAAPAQAETAFPSLHDVAGVAANDVLNLRASPDAGAAIVGSLPPGLTGVEVVGLSEDGKWGRVNQSETAGWASMRFLAPQDTPAWFTLQRGLRCVGTEPFWSLFVDSETGSARFLTPEEEGPEMNITATWPGEDWRPVAALQLSRAEGSGVAVIRTEACSDGMSEMAYGLATDIFLQGKTAAPASALRGCCSLAP